MNKADKEYFENIFDSQDKRLDLLHDDVLIIKTERKQEKKLMAAIAASLAFVVSTITAFLFK